MTATFSVGLHDNNLLKTEMLVMVMLLCKKHYAPVHTQSCSLTVGVCFFEEKKNGIHFLPHIMSLDRSKHIL